MSTTPTFEYFVSRLTDDIRRIREGNANKYDFYETTSHHVDFTINNHRVALAYDLRINVGTEELESLLTTSSLNQGIANRHAMPSHHCGVD